MPKLSASEAISPAIRHARSLFFEPFILGRSWKLAITLYVSRCGLVFVPFFLPVFLVIPLVHNVHDWQADLIAAGVLLFCLLYCFGFYVCSRLQFVALDVVLRRKQFIAPSWKVHRTQSHRWFAFQVLLGTAITLIISLPAVILIRPIWKEWRLDSAGANPHLSGSLFLTVFFTIFLGFLVQFALGAVLSDLVLPAVSLENLKIRQAFSRIRQIVATDPWAFVRFFSLKFLLGLIGQYIFLFAIEIVLLVLLLLLFLIAMVLGSILHTLGIPWYILQGIGEAIGLMVEFVVGFYVMPLALGFFFSCLDSWTLFFLLGRYLQIDENLDRRLTSPIPFTPTDWPLPYVPPPSNWPNTP